MPFLLNVFLQIILLVIFWFLANRLGLLKGDLPPLFTIDTPIYYQVTLLLFVLLPYAVYYLMILLVLSIIVDKIAVLETLSWRSLLKVKRSYHKTISIILNRTEVDVVVNPEDVLKSGVYGVDQTNNRLIYLGSVFYLDASIIHSHLRFVKFRVHVTDFDKKEFYIETLSKITPFINEKAIKKRCSAYVKFLLNINFASVQLDQDETTALGIYSYGVLVTK